MDNNFEELVVDVRARTDGFASDVEAMRRSLDGSLTDGFGRAGAVLERGLLGALRRGSLGFDDLKRVAFAALSEIAAYALQAGIGSLFGGGGVGSNGGGLGGLLSGTLSAAFGLPGRATGGPVAPGRAYVVGEKRPELFIPSTNGRIEPSVGGSGLPPVQITTLIDARGATVDAIAELRTAMAERDARMETDVTRTMQNNIDRRIA